jgi:sugar O-acyltransferase (sialic acid O-acetyltransferase NeuD family)
MAGTKGSEFAKQCEGKIKYMQRLILIGGGGHCKSCIEVIESTLEFSIEGILDVPDKVGTTVAGYPVMGTEDDLAQYTDDYQFLITVGQIRSTLVRKRIYDQLSKAGKYLATVISPNAIVSVRSSIGKGTIIMHGAKVNADTIIGINGIINTNANIEHDCRIGDYVHVSTGALLNGGCVVKSETFIGSGAVLVNDIQITANSIIGAGTVVHRTINEPGSYIGNPCRKII